MLKLSGFESTFAAAGNLYLLLMAGCLIFALWKGKTWTVKIVYAAIVAALFMAPIAPAMYDGIVYRGKLAKAQALFDERCKTAGEKIYKTVENVDGITLLKVRPPYETKFSYDALHPGAAAIGESGGDDYIASFLVYDQSEPAYPHRRWRLTNMETANSGFKYVDATDSIDGKQYRYTAQFGSSDNLPVTYFHKLVKTINSQPVARYAVTFEDVVDTGDRNYWIAGTRIKVIDRQTNEILAEQLRYLFDSGLGSTAGDRSPWSWASSYVPGCPVGLSASGGTRFFVTQVLKPSKAK